MSCFHKHKPVHGGFYMYRSFKEWRENLDKNYVMDAVFMDLSKVFDFIPMTY